MSKTFRKEDRAKHKDRYKRLRLERQNKRRTQEPIRDNRDNRDKE